MGVNAMSDITESYPSVAAFTDTYEPTINGVTYTVEAWRDAWCAAGGEMTVVYPDGEGYECGGGEYAVSSVPVPWYPTYFAGLPVLPSEVKESSFDIVHTHTLFSVGMAGRRLARRQGCPLVASYHTPIEKYVRYVTGQETIDAVLSHVLRRYEHWFLERVEHVIVPSQDTKEYVRDSLAISTPVSVISNGINTGFFEPVPTQSFTSRYTLPEDEVLVGYTGRHGYEKNLSKILPAVEALDRSDVTVVFGGEGPAQTDLEAQAQISSVDVRFLGRLDREELPELYSALDVFLFPSPVETEGLVAMEAMACGTPVVGVDSGALQTTISEGETGYRVTMDTTGDFVDAITKALQNREELQQHCLQHRTSFGVEDTRTQLRELYQSLL